MVDFRVATGGDDEQPLNRTAVDNVQVSGDGIQATPVGIDNSGAEPQLVAADADAGTAIPCLGLLLPEKVVDLSALSDVNELHDMEARLHKQGSTLVGDRATYFQYGVEVVNDDGNDAAFTPGEPVYLAPGGGFTQTKPSTAGALVQCVGVALTPKKMRNEEFDRFYLQIDYDYATV